MSGDYPLKRFVEDAMDLIYPMLHDYIIGSLSEKWGDDWWFKGVVDIERRTSIRNDLSTAQDEDRRRSLMDIQRCCSIMLFHSDIFNNPAKTESARYVSPAKINELNSARNVLHHSINRDIEKSQALSIIESIKGFAEGLDKECSIELKHMWDLCYFDLTSEYVTKFPVKHMIEDAFDSIYPELHNYVIAALKGEFGDRWWIEGVVPYEENDDLKNSMSCISKDENRLEMMDITRCCRVILENDAAFTSPKNEMGAHLRIYTSKKSVKALRSARNAVHHCTDSDLPIQVALNILYKLRSFIDQISPDRAKLIDKYLHDVENESTAIDESPHSHLPELISLLNKTEFSCSTPEQGTEEYRIVRYSDDVIQLVHNCRSQYQAESLAYLCKQVDSGDAQAMFELAYRYYVGGNDEDVKKAIELWQLAAELNDSSSQICISYAYYRGIIIKKSEEKCCYWINKAGKNDPIGQFYTARLFLEGNVLCQSTYNALEQFKKSAESGFSLSAYHIGKLYYEGFDVTRSSTLAAYWFQRAADLELSDAQVALALMYAEGDGVPRSESKMIDLLRRASDHDNPVANYNLALSYFNGLTYHISRQEATALLRKAADAGYENALYRLGLLYSDPYGEEYDLDKGVDILTRLSENGNNDAMIELGLALLIGQSPKSKFDNVNYIYEDTLIYFKKNKYPFELALKWIKTAAENGSERANDLLPYAENYCTKGDSNTRSLFNYFDKRAMKDDVLSQYIVGMMYLDGFGVEVSTKQALKNWQKAADKGYANAKCMLALAYIFSVGVKKSMENAVVLLSNATAQDYAPAQVLLDAIQKTKNKQIPLEERNLTLLKYANDQHCRYFQTLYAKELLSLGDLGKTDEAITTLTEAARFYPEAQYQLALLYLEGKYLPQEILHTKTLLVQAYGSGHKEALWASVLLSTGHESPEVIRLIIDYWKNGFPDENKLSIILRKLMVEEPTFGPDEHMLAIAHLEGSIEGASVEKGIALLEKLAKGGDASAQYELAMLYKDMPEIRDERKAFKWMKKASESKDAAYLFGLGKFYIEGIGVKKSVDTAV